jgi:hypothetical protein
LRLQCGDTLSGLVELFAGALQSQLQTRDSLLEFDGLWDLELTRRPWQYGRA